MFEVEEAFTAFLIPKKRQDHLEREPANDENVGPQSGLHRVADPMRRFREQRVDLGFDAGALREHRLARADDRRDDRRELDSRACARDKTSGESIGVGGRVDFTQPLERDAQTFPGKRTIRVEAARHRAT